MSKLLEYQNVEFLREVNNDSGLGTTSHLRTLKPTLPDGWFYLGPGATTSNVDHTSGVIVKPLNLSVLADVDDWILVWDDAGSGKKTDYALWRGVGPPHYVVMGGFFTRSYNKPTVQETQGLKAIHISALNRTEVGDMIWDDKGSRATKYGSIWGISNPGQDTVDSGAFIPGTDQKPKVAYRLNTDLIQEKKIELPPRRSLDELD